eukprot:138682-Prorocentrum_minimum.AAC.2
MIKCRTRARWYIVSIEVGAPCAPPPAPAPLRSVRSALSPPPRAWLSPPPSLPPPPAPYCICAGEHDTCEENGNERQES